MSTDPEHRDDGDQVASVHYLPAATAPDGEGQQSNDDGQDGTGVELAPEVVDAEIVEETRDPAVWRPPVVERRPVVAPWVRDAEQRRAAARWAAGHAWHGLKWHSVRMPWVALRLAAHSPRGMARALSLWAGWLFDTEAHALRMAAVSATEFGAYMQLTKSRNSRVKIRLAITGVTLALAMVGLVVADHYWPPAQWAFLALALAAFGVAGARRADRPIITPARTVTTVAPRLTADVVTRALGALGIAEVNKALVKGPGITFAGPITRDGPGWRADVDLPFGVTAADIMERRAALASGLRRPLGCVWPEPSMEEHTGRLTLWVGDEDMSRSRPKPWPLGKTGAVDLFAQVPFGVDPRGRWVTLTLMYANVLIGAMPGAGKTFALRVLLLACALDPSAELRIFELKGSGDLSPLEPVAHRYGSGPDDATLDQVMESLRQVYAELETRAKTIRDLPREVCPENKVTRQLANRRRLGLHPLVLAIDECQELFSDQARGKEAAELAIGIIKRGRALGVILILATQRPDKDSLPTGVSANVGIRFCLRVMGQIENDMILGTSAYKNGLRASTFAPKDKGIGYLVGAADEPAIVRSAYLDAPAAEKVTQRARVLRENANTITGYAAGERPGAPPAVDLLAAVAGCYAPGEDGLHSEVICARLAEAHPAFAGWTPTRLAGALRAYNLTPTQVWATDPADGKAKNRNGHRREAVMAAMTNRT